MNLNHEEEFEIIQIIQANTETYVVHYESEERCWASRIDVIALIAQNGKKGIFYCDCDSMGDFEPVAGFVEILHYKPSEQELRLMAEVETKRKGLK